MFKPCVLAGESLCVQAGFSTFYDFFKQALQKPMVFSSFFERFLQSFLNRLFWSFTSLFSVFPYYPQVKLLKNYINTK